MFKFDLLIFVPLSLLLSLSGLYYVRKYLKKHNFKSHQDVTGYYLSIVCSLYAILLGLVVFNFQVRFEQAKTMAETEVNTLSDMYQLTRGFPEEQRHVIRMAIKNYYLCVQDEDWEAIAAGKTKEASIHYYAELWKTVTEFKPHGEAEDACYAQILSSMSQFSDSRRPRTLASKHPVSPMLWIVLIAGAVLIIIFTYFFWVEHAATQYALTAMVAIFLSLNLLLIKSYENPYRREHLLKESTFNYKRDAFADAAYKRNVNHTTTQKQPQPEQSNAPLPFSLPSLPGASPPSKGAKTAP